MALSTISIVPATPDDYMPLARLEHQVYSKDNWTIVAYGPDRNSEEAVEWLAAALSRQPTQPGASQKIMKAVCGEEIVGFAMWSLEPNDRKEVAKTKGSVDVDEGKPKVEMLGPWPPGANVRFCEDAYVVGDRSMLESVKGEPYAKLFVLSILPSYQRRGIGSMLMEAFIQDVDRVGVSAILGASKEGLGLYRRFGFEVVVRMELDLREYGGTEDMGIEPHIIMKRPARNK